MIPVLQEGSIYLQILRFLGTFVAGILVTRLLLMPATRKTMSKRSKKASHSTENIIGLVGFFLTLALALQAGGFGNMLTVVGTIAAAATVGIGFGMRDQIASVIAGFFIYTDNPFLKGDYIKVNDIEGRVMEIHLRTTVLKGGNSEIQVVPNNILTTNNMKNYTRSDRTKISLEFKEAAEKLDDYEEIIENTAVENEKVLKKLKPEIRYTGIEEGKGTLVLNAWVKERADVRSIRSEIYRSIIEKADKKGILESKKE